MTYLSDTSKALMSVAIHPFTGRSGNIFTFSTPTNLGEGVSRPDNQTFRLAEGRHYVLLGGSCIYRSGTPSGNIQYRQTFINAVTSVELGKHGGIRNAYSSDMIYRNPVYRQEAVVFIRASDINTYIDIRLKRVIEVGNDTGYTTASTGWSDPAVVIMSIPE